MALLLHSTPDLGPPVNHRQTLLLLSRPQMGLNLHMPELDNRFSFWRSCSTLQTRLTVGHHFLQSISQWCRTPTASPHWGTAPRSLPPPPSCQESGQRVLQEPPSNYGITLQRGHTALRNRNNTISSFSEFLWAFPPHLQQRQPPPWDELSLIQILNFNFPFLCVHNALQRFATKCISLSNKLNLRPDIAWRKAGKIPCSKKKKKSYIIYFRLDMIGLIIQTSRQWCLYGKLRQLPEGRKSPHVYVIAIENCNFTFTFSV